MTTSVARPKYLNLLKIRLPITGVASIAHRISGVLLIIAIPVTIYCLAMSLRSAEDYALLGTWLKSGWMRVILPLWVWAISHHLLAGIRFLLMDVGLGMQLATARRSAMWVITLAAVVFLVTLSRGH